MVLRVDEPFHPPHRSLGVMRDAWAEHPGPVRSKRAAEMTAGPSGAGLDSSAARV